MEANKEIYPLLLAEDDNLLSQAIKDFLESRGYRVYAAGTCREAQKILDQHIIHVALVDKKLPDGEGTTILGYILDHRLKTKMILMTAYGSDQKIKEYVEKGAFDFLEKPFSLETLLKRIENAGRMFELEYSHDALESYQKSAVQIIGQGPAITRIKKMISLVAQADSPVLIQGETGTGKELVARSIHLESSRSKKQFISVNCASIPEQLFESEFFGYEKGAFTGAFRDKPGYFEMANFGVLHLDEIGDMPLEFQAKLLRVLEEGSYIKLGGSKEMRVDVRIIASTNKDLKEEVAKKRFRQDLYFRIVVFTIELPPLRDRREDIPLIAQYLWHGLGAKGGQADLPAPAFFTALKDYPWRGNVRELRNFLEKKKLFAGLEPEPEKEGAFSQSGGETGAGIIPLEDYLRHYVLQTLKTFDHNKAQTARALGLGLSTLKRKLKSWGEE